MTTFIIVACVMVLICLLALILPLSRNNTSAPIDSGNYNIEIAREKLADLEIQKDAGSISDTEFNKLSEDAKRVLILETGQDVTHALSHGNPLLLSVGIAALVPILALTLYLMLGTPEGLAHNAMPGQQAAADAGQNIDSLLQSLQDKLADNPDDAEGWALLGRTSMSMQRFAQAQNAFSNLRRIVGDAPSVMLQLADAEVMLNGGAFTQETRNYVTTAYAAEPNNIQAIWMTAMLDTQEGNLTSAISKWEQLEVLLAGQPEQQARIRQLIVDARGAVEQLPRANVLADTLVNTSEQAIRAANLDGVSVSIEVSLSADLPKPVQNEQLVYVYARAVSGPPMPLAAKQLRVADLPTTITLTEQDAVIDGMTLARFPRIVLGARISMTGEPTAQPGDIQNITRPLDLPLEEPVRIEIKDLVK
ncbi:MAG: c-type cytochrome biogenesis protein CcmI [Proteobacteria bacterium]|jgi:cytochrome c-type biogenesis protein CcmH|nr:c-type cytochrome biogenesis protein CcmI [Pseudomonadota bacterium]